VYSGSIINLNTLLKIVSLFSIQDNYGINSTVTYHAPFFVGLSTIDGHIPIIEKVSPEDYLLVTFTLPNMTGYNIFNLTPYFFKTNQQNVFASTDETIQFTKTAEGTTYKICITSSQRVAKLYKHRGYIISKLPYDLLYASSFTLLFRLGMTDASSGFFNSISDFVTCQYYKSSLPIKDQYKGKHYTSSLIKQLRAPELKPPFCDLTTFEQVKRRYLRKGFIPKYSYKYLSNIYGTNYAMKDVYDAISIRRHAQLQADNSGEAYFNSDIIPLRGIKNIYIIALNHNKLGVALTSSVQLYNWTNLSPLKTFATSPDLPSMTSPDYPMIPVNKMPSMRIIKLNIQRDFSDVGKLFITERICYTPDTFTRPSYDYKGNCALFIEYTR